MKSEHFVLKVIDILDLFVVFLRIILVDLGIFDGEHKNFWNKLLKFLLFSYPTNQLLLKLDTAYNQ